VSLFLLLNQFWKELLQNLLTFYAVNKLAKISQIHNSRIYFFYTAGFNDNVIEIHFFIFSIEMELSDVISKTSTVESRIVESSNLLGRKALI